jgi:hypothetical protein
VVEFSKPFLEQLFAGVDLTADPQAPVVFAKKQGYLVQVTNEQLQDADVWPVKVLTPEERDKQLAALREQQMQEVAQTTLRLATAHPALMPVIDLHSPENTRYGLYCGGCDAGAYAGDSPEWPCSTIELILDGLGPHIMHNGRKLSPACGKRYMDGRNEVRCWLPEAHDGECK